MQSMIKKYQTIEEIGDYLIDELEKNLVQGKGDFHLALSGGRTPKKIFEHFLNHYKDFPYWDRIHFWWGDERLVPLDSPESNGGNACRTLLNHLEIPQGNIHLLKHADNPEEALIDYYNQLSVLPRDEQNRPYLHWTWLGLGEDGHTASLFPDFKDWNIQDNLILRKHPESGQLRLSFGPALLERSVKTSFIVTGDSKKKVLQDIVEENEKGKSYPAFKISKRSRQVEWICDTTAVPKAL